MADTTATTTSNNSFLSGIWDGVGALSNAYATVVGAGKTTSATPGATGAATAAAQPATASSSILKTVLIGVVVAVLALVGIKLIAK